MRDSIFSLFMLMALLSLSNAFGQSAQTDTIESYLGSKAGLEKAEAYYNIVFKMLRSDHERAKEYIQQYERLVRDETNPVYEAYVHVNYGQYYSVTGKMDSAAYHLERAKKTGRGENTLLLIRAESSLGKVYISQGKPEKGLENLFEALRLLQITPDKESEIKVRINIMWAYLELKRYRDCIQFGRNALNYVSASYTWMLPYIYNNLAVSYGGINQIDSAKYFIEKSLPIALANSDNNMLANAHFILGTIYSNSGKYDLAIEQYEKSKPYRKKVGNPFFIVADQYTLSDLYAKSGDYQKGIEAGLEGLKMAEQNNLILKFEGVYHALAKNYEGAGDYQNASRYYNLWAVAKDSVYKNATANAMAEMQTKYETERKELLIYEQQLKLQRNQIIMLALFVLLILIVIVVFLWRNQLKLKEQKKLEQQQREFQENLTHSIIQLQENERSRFAKDLHDGFGQMITALKMQLESARQNSEGVPELIQQMHDEIRNVSFALSPQVLVRDGLVFALKELAFRMNRAGTVKLSIQTTGLEERLSQEYEVALYRVCQEWINNVMKYSGATHVSIQLVDHDDEVTLMIEDNGRGFDQATLLNGRGNGWKNIQSRIQILRGTVEVDTVYGTQGCTFIANIPKASMVSNHTAQ